MDMHKLVGNEREAIINKIKCAGQELIDRAESMVSEDLDWITDFDIFISFSDGALTEITTTTRMACKNEHKMVMNQLTHNN